MNSKKKSKKGSSITAPNLRTKHINLSTSPSILKSNQIQSKFMKTIRTPQTNNHKLTLTTKILTTKIPIRKLLTRKFTNLGIPIPSTAPKNSMQNKQVPKATTLSTITKNPDRVPAVQTPTKIYRINLTKWIIPQRLLT